jgi:hypothetical protein
MKLAQCSGSKASHCIVCLACLGIAQAIATPARSEPPGWIRGNEVLVAKVRDILADRGLHPDRRRDEGQSVHVTATWPDGRILERIVATPETAATVIESLDRHDLADPLLVPRRLPTKAATPVAPPLPVSVTYTPIVSATSAAPPLPVSSTPATTPSPATTLSPVSATSATTPPPAIAASATTLPPIAATHSSSHFFAGVGGSAAVGTDGSIALGATVSSCFPIGRTCLGARIRYLDGLRSPRGDGATVDEPAHVDIERSNLDLLAAIELPIPWGAYHLVPGAAFGARLVFLHAKVRRAEQESHPWGASAELSMDVVRVFGNGLALSLGMEAQALLGPAEDGSEFENAWISGQPHWSMLLNAGVRFYP